MIRGFISISAIESFFIPQFSHSDNSFGQSFPVHLRGFPLIRPEQFFSFWFHLSFRGRLPSKAERPWRSRLWVLQWICTQTEHDARPELRDRVRDRFTNSRDPFTIFWMSTPSKTFDLTHKLVQKHVPLLPNCRRLSLPCGFCFMG